jgi:chromosome segregation ATPase
LHLKALRMRGFKSFAERVELAFEPGIDGYAFTFG